MAEEKEAKPEGVQPTEAEGNEAQPKEDGKGSKSSTSQDDGMD